MSEGHGELASAPEPLPAPEPAHPPIFRAPPPPRPGDRPGPEPVPAPATPSPDLAPVDAQAVVPGEHRGGFHRLPTAPTGVAVPMDAEAAAVAWSAPEASALPSSSLLPHGLAGWSLVFAVAGLVFSLFVGWAFPLGMVGIAVGIAAVRRPIESRAAAVWAICLGAVSVLYSAGWLLWAATGGIAPPA